MLCPLCQFQVSDSVSHSAVPGVHYHCSHCDLIFKDPSSHLDWDQQKARYDLHNNQETPEYLQFFEKLLTPLRPFLRDGARILDWGSGPVPVLAHQLRREGFAVDTFDPVYQVQAPGGSYEVITCTEVIEHFQNPQASFVELFSHLLARGLFAGMTNFHQGPGSYKDWWYAKDPTHVVFYSEKTFHWVAANWNFEILHLKSPVFIFRQKKS